MNRPLTTLFVGLGSPHGDDAVGWRIAEMVAAEEVPGVTVRRASSPLDLLDWLGGIERLAICDACDSPNAAGTLYDWYWPVAAILPRPLRNSHAIGLVEALQLAEQVGRLPQEVRIYAVAGSKFQPGEPVSAGLEAVLPAIVARLIGDLAHARTFVGSGAA
jgi:hydrogenase maturation protease